MSISDEIFGLYEHALDGRQCAMLCLSLLRLVYRIRRIGLRATRKKSRADIVSCMPRLLRASGYRARLPWRQSILCSSARPIPTNRLRRHSIKRISVRAVGSPTSPSPAPPSVRVSRHGRWRCRWVRSVSWNNRTRRLFSSTACVSALSRSTFRPYHTAIARNGCGSQRYYQSALV